MREEIAMLHKITAVTPRKGFKILAHFSDGSAKEYDMVPLMDSIEAFKPLRTIPGLFEQVSADPGGYGVSWNDDIDLDASEIWVNGVDVSTPFDGLISFVDATALWNLSESTLRKAVSYKKLINGVDVLKFGKQWVVTREAMTREYGPLA